MRNWKYRIIVALVLAMVPETAVTDTILDVKLITEKKDYLFSEHVYFFLDACNPTGQPYTETFSCMCCIYKIAILDNQGAMVAYYDDGKSCPQTSVRLNWKPQGCLSLGPFTWLQTRGGFPVPGDGEQISAGEYRVFAKWENGPEVISDPITILEKQKLSSGARFSRAGIIFLAAVAVGVACIIVFVLRRK
jgi:hypothetical protein